VSRELPRDYDILRSFRFANMGALQEIHRVLKPGGKLAMIWNVDDCESKPGLITSVV
jgi:ubiquinone/menaquinone biosynthesis C-methylase UbiE